MPKKKRLPEAVKVSRWRDFFAHYGQWLREYGVVLIRYADVLGQLMAVLAELEEKEEA